MVITLSILTLHRGWYCVILWTQPCSFVSLSLRIEVRFPHCLHTILSINLITSIFYVVIIIIMSKTETIMALPSSFTKLTCKFFITNKETSCKNLIWVITSLLTLDFLALSLHFTTSKVIEFLELWRFLQEKPLVKK